MTRFVLGVRDLPPQNGFDLRAVLVPDIDSTPYDADCYSAEDIAAWQRDDWCYVELWVIASRCGIRLGDACIGNIEFGSLAELECDPLPDAPGFTVVPIDADGKPDDSRARTEITFGNGYGADLVDEALADARATLARLNAA
ncbi:hypothetical protein ACFWPH_28290 [Nocardia sp. NPDC058499]|uniref:hypothetical protein n=1 Tax=Nocardia sp. NPDC058499 TaxID=3346530 RepID=UPI0036488D8A